MLDSKHWERGYLDLLRESMRPVTWFDETRSAPADFPGGADLLLGVLSSWILSISIEVYFDTCKLI